MRPSQLSVLPRLSEFSPNEKTFLDLPAMQQPSAHVPAAIKVSMTLEEEDLKKKNVIIVADAELKRVKLALAREVEARAAERAGRIRAERALRDAELILLTPGTRVGKSEPNGTDAANASSRLFPLLTLGQFESSFSRRNGTPRQPHLVPMARGRVKLHSHVPKAALEGLHEFSHVWLIYVFHANTDLQQSVGARAAGQDRKRSTARAKVRVPRLNGERRGVLATRSPHRPVPVGLSLATVRAVDLKEGVLEVGGADLVDGTPVLDIKPYLPFCDAPPVDGAPPFAPDWVAVESSLPGGEPLKLASVRWAPGARECVQSEWKARGGAPRSLYDNTDDLTLFVEQALSRDIRSAHQRQGEEDTSFDGGAKWEVILDGILIRYDIMPSGEVVIANSTNQAGDECVASR